VTELGLFRNDRVPEELCQCEPLNGSHPAACFRAADGTLVVEVVLRAGGAESLARLIEDARRAGVGAIWARASELDVGPGFRARGGYARFEAERLPTPAELAPPPLRQVRALQSACFSGVWGRAEPAEEPDPDLLFVGLYESGAWVGICGVDVDDRSIDGPGLLPGFRTADRYARLVRGAATLVRNGPVTLESWGDSEETLVAYRALGFVLVEYQPGWELLL
jgi:hypothetical protein